MLSPSNDRIDGNQIESTEIVSGTVQAKIFPLKGNGCN